MGPTCLKEKQLLTLTPFHWSLLLSGLWTITSISNSILARTQAIQLHRPNTQPATVFTLFSSGVFICFWTESLPLNVSLTAESAKEPSTFFLTSSLSHNNLVWPANITKFSVPTNQYTLNSCFQWIFEHSI